MGKRNQERTVNSFQELAKLVTPFPDLPEIEVTETVGLEKQAEKVREGAAKVADWVRSAVAFLEQAAGLSREARELVEEKIHQAKEGLDRLLHQERVKAYRRTAWLEVLRHLLNQEVESTEEVKDLVRELVDKGYLVENHEGSLSIGSSRYGVPVEAAFEEPEIEEISRLVEALSVKVLQAEKMERRRQAENLLAQSEMTLAEFLGGNKGKFALQVPPEEVPGQNGAASYWRAGGLLLVESDGETIRPLSAVGNNSFVGAVEETRELGVYLYFQSLEWERPPYIKALPEENRKKLQLLWYFLQRGINNLRVQEKILEEKTEMTKKATVTPQEFFLEGESGVCFAEYSGVWHMPENGGTIPNLFFLVERRKKEEEGSTIVLLEMPTHVREFLGHLVGKEAEEKEVFGGIGYPLKGILQAIYGQVQKSVQIQTA